MRNPDYLLLSDLLKKEVKDLSSLSFGVGDISWIHLPSHRILGWSSKSYDFSKTRNIWRLDQIKTLIDKEVLVYGKPSINDISIINSIPNIINSKLINNFGNKIGIVADFLFELKTGNIKYYLISRNNPNIPGSSRWKLEKSSIIDYQSGFVFTEHENINELLIVKSSLREDFNQNSKTFIEKLNMFKNIASTKVEKWLEEDDIEDNDSYQSRREELLKNDDYEYDNLYDENEFFKEKRKSKKNEDPWF